MWLGVAVCGTGCGGVGWRGAMGKGGCAMGCVGEGRDRGDRRKPSLWSSQTVQSGSGCQVGPLAPNVVHARGRTERDLSRIVDYFLISGRHVPHDRDNEQ